MRSNQLTIGVDASSLISMRPRGEGKSLLSLYQEIATLRPDWRIIFYGEDKVSTNSDVGISNCELKYFKLPGYRVNSWLNVGLPYHAWQDKVDILHCSSTFAPYFSINPIVLTVHDIIPLVSETSWTAARIERFRTCLARSLNNAKHVISVSESTKNDLINTFSINPDKITVVHWGCDQVNNNFDSDCLNKLKINTPYIMAFGGDDSRKNTNRILEAFKLFNDRVQSEVSLVLIGINSDKLRESLAGYCKSLNILDKVVLLPYISESELAVLYRFTECLLYPSLYEGFGMPLLEAMSRGTAIITSNVSSMPEVLGDAGLVIDPCNTDEIARAIEILVTDHSLRQKYQVNSLIRSKQFSWKNTAEQYISIFERIVSDHN